MKMGTKYKYAATPSLRSGEIRWEVAEYKLFGVFGIGVWLEQDYTIVHGYDEALELINKLVKARKDQKMAVVVNGR